MTGRDVVGERAFLAASEERGTESPWIAAVLERLAEHDGPDQYDGSFRWMSLPTLVRELVLETIDMGGYGALLSERLGTSHDDLSEKQRERLGALLTAIEGLGARAHELAEQAQKLVGPPPKEMPR